ncbi:MAG: hypothetical protein K0S44_1528 [Bacteroidetes bacterium]|jgi:hypothetical protein|nr:hypothetical protein [Bacteroidota bacterium]
MTDNTDIEFQARIRENILYSLDLWTSKEKQFDYQKSVPIADVSAELFCGWDDFYHPDNTDFINAFNGQERQILADFNRTLTVLADKTPNILPNIVEFVQTEEWKKINSAATETLNKIKSL